MKTLKYGNETIVIEDESSEGKTGIAIHNIDDLDDTVVINTKEIKNALEDTITDLKLDLEEEKNE
jgi:predicted transcriptional regulator